MRRLQYLLPLMLLSLLLLQPSYVFAADQWARVRGFAALPVSRQQDEATQAEFQRWFMARIAAYASSLNDTAVGKAGIINLGDFSRQAKTLLCPPIGTGEYRIVFNDCSTAGVPEYGARVIQFPKSQMDEYIDGGSGRFNTCWHEFQHVMAMAREANGRPLLIDYDQWESYAKPPPDDVKEHIYIESLAEYTVEWLDTLLHEKTAFSNGVGAGKSFEKYVLEAASKQKELEKKGTYITYGMEHEIWGKAHDAWASVWPLALKIAPLPEDLRKDYEDMSGVHIPYVEEVIELYHSGGLKDSSGNGIHVPRWVMESSVMKSAVIINHTAATKKINGNELRYNFAIRILEGYRYRDRTQSVNVGKVTIKLEGGSGPTLQVSVDGKPVGNGQNVVVDLHSFKKDSSIEITFVHPSLDSIANENRYTVRVSFREDPVVSGGKVEYQGYYNSEAVYNIDVKGTKQKSASPAPPSKPSEDVNASDSKSEEKSEEKSDKESGQWVLTRSWVDDKSDAISDEVQAGKVDFELNKNEFRITASESNNFDINHDIKVTWEIPPVVIKPDDEVILGLHLDVLKGKASNINSCLVMWRCECDKEEVVGFADFVSAMCMPNSGGIGGLSDFSYDTISDAPGRFIFDKGQPGDKIRLIISAKGNCLNNKFEGNVYWEYIWQEGPLKDISSEEVAEVTMEAQEPPLPEEDPIMDDRAPEPGEVIKLAPPEKEVEKGGADEVTVTKTEPNRWYVHPSGDYRFRLADGWSVFANQMFDEKSTEYDTIMPETQEMAMVVSKSANDIGSRDVDKILSQFERNLKKGSSDGKSQRRMFGPSEGLIVPDYNKEDGTIFWYVAFCYEGKSYFISIGTDSDSEQTSLPPVVDEMLSSIEFKSQK